MKTSPRIHLGLYDQSVRLAGVVATNFKQPFSKLTDLQYGIVDPTIYATFEPDYWLLDGSFKLLPADASQVHVGLMAGGLSMGDGSTGGQPYLKITFPVPVSIGHFSLVFSLATGDWVDWITYEFRDSGAAVLASGTWYPDSPEFTAPVNVSGVKEIILWNWRTNKPERFVRVTEVGFGELVVFDEAGIKAADLVEEIDPVSIELPYNTADLTLYSADAEFSILNPDGKYGQLHERLPLRIYENVNGITRYVGTYYLDEWENESDTISIFRTVDLLGVLDRMTCYGGIWTTPTSLNTILLGLLDPINVPFEVDPLLAAATVQGWIPVCSYREALQHLAIAAGAVITCTRSSLLRVLPARIPDSSLASDFTILEGEQGDERRLALREYVTGVEVTGHQFYASSESVTLFDGTLEAGVHLIEFSEPMYSLSVTPGVTLQQAGANWCRIQAPSTQAVVLTGLKFADQQRAASVSGAIPNGGYPNVVQVKDATMIGLTQAAGVAQRLYDYYQARYRQTMKLYAPIVEVTDMAVIDSLFGKQIKGLIERMSTDLAGGFVSDVEATGVAFTRRPFPL